MAPFPISIETGMMEPNGLNLLQGVYDEYCRLPDTSPDRERAHVFAQNLVVAYKVGIRNPELLQRMALPWRGQMPSQVGSATL
jgi:hypothetical protein